MGVDLKDHLEVHLLEPGAGDLGTTLVASVVNVSLRGLGIKLSHQENVQKIQLGQNLVASIEIDKFSVPLTVEVVRFVGNDGLGVRFKPPFPKELVRLERFLEPRVLGPTMREIKSDALQQGEGKMMRWHQGANDTHLFSWSHPTDGTVLQQQLIFLDKVAEWGQTIPLRTGRIQREDDSAATAGRFGWVRSELLDFDPQPDTEFLRQARTLLESADVSEDLKQMFLKKIDETI